jgi:integrase
VISSYCVGVPTTELGSGSGNQKPDEPLGYPSRCAYGQYSIARHGSPPPSSPTAMDAHGNKTRLGRRGALCAAKPGIVNLIFHDLRGTAVTRLSEAESPAIACATWALSWTAIRRGQRNSP